LFFEKLGKEAEDNRNCIWRIIGIVGRHGDKKYCFWEMPEFRASQKWDDSPKPQNLIFGKIRLCFWEMG